MSSERASADQDRDVVPMTRTYIGVVVLEVIVLLALWMFQWYFGR